MSFNFPVKLGLFESSYLAIDLGTSNTLIYNSNEGLVLNEASLVAIDRKTGKLFAVGKEVKEMVGRTPEEIKVVQPMRDGVIADFRVVEQMLRYFIGKTQKKRLFLKPVVAVAVPSGITPVEKRAVINSVEESGARNVYLVSEPISAAVGIGLPVKEPTGNLIIDIGGGTTEIAVIAMSGIVNKVSIKVAGNELDEAIQTYLYDKYNVAVGLGTAEKIKVEIGSAYPEALDREMTVKGGDLMEGMPTQVTINSEEVRKAIKEPLALIINSIKKALAETPPELSSDIVDKGVMLTGGGSLLTGIDRVITDATGLKVTVAEEPLNCVVKGTGIIIRNLDEYRDLLMPGNF